MASIVVNIQLLDSVEVSLQRRVGNDTHRNWSESGSLGDVPREKVHLDMSGDRLETVRHQLLRLVVQVDVS